MQASTHTKPQLPMHSKDLRVGMTMRPAAAFQASKVPVIIPHHVQPDNAAPLPALHAARKQQCWKLNCLAKDVGSTSPQNKVIKGARQQLEDAAQRHIEAVEELEQQLPSHLYRMGREAGTLIRRSRQRAWQDLHKPAGLIMFPAWLLGACASILDVPGPVWAPTATGAAIGATFVLLNRHCNVRRFIAPPQPMTVVLTGGSKGLGKALARELLLGGDRVILTSRTQDVADQVVAQLKNELGDDADVHGLACDVANANDVKRLEEHAVGLFGKVDVWINNAAYSGSFQPFLDADSEQLEQVVSTNLLGVTLCSRQAARLFTRQETGGHLFNMDGAGADGFPTPNYAAYGATKAGIRQLSLSLQAELRDTEARIHLLSPGMILTDLLLEGATTANKQAFNILCEHPETTAAFLAPRIRSVVARGLRDTYVRYLTPTSALWRFLTAPMRVGRYFDAEGNPVYPPERERMYGRFAKQTARRVWEARRQDKGLQIAYSMSLAVAVALLVIDASLATAGASATHLLH